MTESIINIMQDVAAREVEKIYTTELGIVTALFPHASDGDKDNYQVSVKLKNRRQPDGSDFELRKVPVATQHLGLVNIPNVGDLVLIAFIGGDVNAPVITGRLYNDEDRPPVNQEQELLLQHNLEKGASLKLDADGVLTLAGQESKSTITLEDDTIMLVHNEDQNKVVLEEGKVTVSCQQEKSTITLEGGTVTIATANGQVTLTIAEGGITLDATSKPVAVKTTGEITIGDATTSQVKIGGRMLANAVGDNDDIILSTHTHLGNLGAPCPVLVPTEKINSIQAKGRNTQVG